MKCCGYKPGVITVTTGADRQADLILVRDQGKVAVRDQVQRDLDTIVGWTIDGLAEEAGLSREWVGKMLSGKVDGSTAAWKKLAAAVERIRREDGHMDTPTHYADEQTLTTISAEGVFGVARLTVSNPDPEIAEATMARLIEDVRRASSSPDERS